MESHDKAAALFDEHDEPVHRPAERCKFHQRCFRVIGSISISSFVSIIITVDFVQGFTKNSQI